GSASERASGGLKLFELTGLHANLRVPPRPPGASLPYHLLAAFLLTPPKVRPSKHSNVSASAIGAASHRPSASTSELSVPIARVSGTLCIRYVHFICVAAAAVVAAVERYTPTSPAAAASSPLNGLAAIISELRPNVHAGTRLHASASVATDRGTVRATALS